MTDLIVCDASAVVALLTDAGKTGQWVATAMQDAVLAAPDLLPFEVAKVLRRLERRGQITSHTATQAHLDLVDLAVQAFPYTAVADRVWALRTNMTSYDASYIAVAEVAGATLFTLDQRLAGAPGIACPVVVGP